MPTDASKRVVVTGAGLITPIGSTIDTYWKSLVAGRSGISKLTRLESSAYRTRIAGQIEDFEAGEFIGKKELRRMDRFTHLAIAATTKAIEDAKLELDDETREKTGVILGSAVAGIISHEIAAKDLFTKGSRHINPFTVPLVMFNAGASNITMHFGITGISFGLATACSSGTNAIGEAYLRIKHGMTDVMIAGGSEAPLSPVCFAAWDKLRAMSAKNFDPQRACRPFSKDRDGLVMSEGAGMVILESLERAEKRGAQVLGEITGYGTTSDAFHITYPNLTQQARAMTMALDDAGIKPDDIDYINAHGTGTGANDKVESEAIEIAFGENAKSVPISSTKSMLGHALGASGALELITCLLAMRDNLVPPTINYTEKDPDCTLDYIPNECRKVEVETTLSNSFGFGGANAVLVAKKFKE